MKLKPVNDGQWISPIMHGYKMQCCDCGLIHEMDFAVIDSDGNMLNDVYVYFRAYRKDKKKERKKNG
jgi:transcriptional accessory protein Tex/SPT6